MGQKGSVHLEINGEPTQNAYPSRRNHFDHDHQMSDPTVGQEQAHVPASSKPVYPFKKALHQTHAEERQKAERELRAYWASRALSRHRTVPEVQADAFRGLE